MNKLIKNEQNASLIIAGKSACETLDKPPAFFKTGKSAILLFKFVSNFQTKKILLHYEKLILK